MPVKIDMYRVTKMGNIVRKVSQSDTEIRFKRVDGTRGIRQCSLRKWQSWKLLIKH